jgi:hypothetical protein
MKNSVKNPNSFMETAIEKENGQFFPDYFMEGKERRL